MDEEQAPPAPAPPPRTPQAFVPLDGRPADSIAVAQQLYEQVYAQVNANLVDAFGEEIQHLRDHSAALESAFNDLNADYAKEFAAQSRAEEFATAIGNAVQFKTFSTMWSSNIMHSLSFDPAWDTWITGFRTMFCSRDSSRHG
ncbi:hypothetical protein FIBSPDRAFT_962509 [Athelia psychrophila]|uniref:Uncharacterized protein n=1 Tax=Athelia psychrophila TaxID=1759441 RepID=A0A166A2I5_9AGAM|nr:hypothetical protein FIBSPDRAFT_962509 [Fibularhizoctonia sp. CBS 109695]